MKIVRVSSKATKYTTYFDALTALKEIASSHNLEDYKKLTVEHHSNSYEARMYTYNGFVHFVDERP